jgi:hypothetical protein
MAAWLVMCLLAADIYGLLAPGDVNLAGRLARPTIAGNADWRNLRVE